jgi:hypothetical protein
MCFFVFRKEKEKKMELFEVPDQEKRISKYWREHFQDEFGMMAVSIARQDARAWDDLAFANDEHSIIWRALKYSFPLNYTENKQDGWIIQGLIGPDDSWRCDVPNVPIELKKLGVLGISFMNTRFMFYLSDMVNGFLVIDTLRLWFSNMRMGNWGYFETLKEIRFTHPEEGHRINAYYFRYFASMLAKILKSDFKLIVHSNALNESEQEPPTKKLTRQEEERLELMPFSMMPNHVRQRVEHATPRFLMSMASAGSRLHAALSINPTVWQEMFSRDFPAEYKYYGSGEVPFFIRFTERRQQQPNRWKRAYLWFRYKLDSLTDIPEHIIENSLHRKLWLLQNMYEDEWENNFIFYKTMLSFPIDFGLHAEPFRQLKRALEQFQEEDLTYESVENVVVNFTEQDFVGKNPLMLQLVQYVFLGKFRSDWEDPDNFKHVIKLAKQTEKDTGVMLKEYQNFCNLMNTCIPHLFAYSEDSVLFNIWDQFERIMFLGLLVGTERMGLTIEESIEGLFLSNELRSTVSHVWKLKPYYTSNSSYRVDQIARHFVRSYTINADVPRSVEDGRIIANKINF